MMMKRLCRGVYEVGNDVMMMMMMMMMMTNLPYHPLSNTP